MDELCAGCENEPALTIAQYHGKTRYTREPCLKLLRDHGVTPRSVVCPKCNVFCKFDGSRVWRCPRTITDEETFERKRCSYKISRGHFLKMLKYSRGRSSATSMSSFRKVSVMKLQVKQRAYVEKRALIGEHFVPKWCSPGPSPRILSEAQE